MTECVMRWLPPVARHQHQHLQQVDFSLLPIRRGMYVLAPELQKIGSTPIFIMRLPFSLPHSRGRRRRRRN